MLVGTLLSAVFLSPLFFLLVLLIGVILAASERKRAGIIVIAAAGCILYLVSIEPIHDALLYPLENRYSPMSVEYPPSFDAIVVLGGGIVDRSPDLGGRASLTPISLKRLAEGVMLFRVRPVPIYVSGGIVRGRSVEPEAEAARRALIALGVPPDMIYVEGASRTTWENARNLAQVLRAAGARAVALVTSACHMPRSALAFSKAGVSFFPAPTDYMTERTRYDLMSFLPSFGDLTESFQALHEYIGLVQYRFLK